jgi:hypothetical protein
VLARGRAGDVKGGVLHQRGHAAHIAVKVARRLMRQQRGRAGWR